MQSVLFRTRTQHGVLAALYLATDADNPWTVRRLAEQVGSSEASVSREVSRLLKAGLVTEQRVGNQRLVRPVTAGAVAHHLAGLLRATIGPVVVLRRLLEDRKDVERAVIFGSYAARAAGGSGPLPGDIDLLLLGEIDPQDAYDLAHRATRETGIEITPVVRTSKEWETDDTGFARTVRERPTIDLLR